MDTVVVNIFRYFVEREFFENAGTKYKATLKKSCVLITKAFKGQSVTYIPASVITDYGYFYTFIGGNFQETFSKKKNC